MERLRSQYSARFKKRAVLAMVSKLQHAATAGTTLNRYLKKYSLTGDIPENIHTKTVHIQQVYNQLKDKQRK
jgi:hypothetical protein